MSAPIKSLGRQAEPSGINIVTTNVPSPFVCRRERGSCRICYSLSGLTNEFDVSGIVDGTSVITGASSKCCGYGSAGGYPKSF